MIGTLEEYPTEELAQAAVNGLRMSINEDRNRQLQQAVYISDVIDHYLETEQRLVELIMPDDTQIMMKRRSG